MLTVQSKSGYTLSVTSPANNNLHGHDFHEDEKTDLGKDQNMESTREAEAHINLREHPPVDQRLAHIDIAKGLCILLVVLGHNWLTLNDTGELYRIIYSFHVPFFFLLAGVFFNPDASFWHIARTRANALLKPYFVTLTAVAIYLGWFAGKTTSPSELFSAVFYGNANIPIWIPLWFLPHLFLLSLFAWLYLTLFQLEKQHPAIKTILLLATLSAGYLTLRLFWNIEIPWGGQEFKLRGLPFSADLLLVTSFYFILGYLFREQIKQPKLNYKWSLLAAALFLGLHIATNFSMDLYLRRYGSLIISTLLALTGIYTTLSISKMIAGFKLLSRSLAYIGSNSLIILLFHNPIQRGLFSALDAISGRKFYGSVLAFTGAVLVCLLIAEVIKRIPVLRLLFMPAARHNTP
jgi:fucose 4-O-acetylase-like acetyltransferase